MFINSISIVRLAFRLTWLVATVSLIGLVALSHVLPATGRQLYVVRGGSMEPAIPVGSAVIVGHVAAPELRVGDVITFKGANGAVITHRVIELPTDGSRAIQTKGDASEATDPFVVPADAVLGRVEVIVPVVGSFLVMLGSTVGLIATLALLGGLLFAIWFMDELLVTLRPARRTAVAEPAG